jgi:hypothetical protein
MGSHPRIADKKGTYDLFGPPNLWNGSSYDKGMVCFLACLKEFADFATNEDVAHGRVSDLLIPPCPPVNKRKELKLSRFRQGRLQMYAFVTKIPLYTLFCRLNVPDNPI